MLSESIRQTAEYRRLLSSVQEKSCAVALFGLPLSARAHIITLLQKDTSRPVLVVCDTEAEATKFCENARTYGAKGEVYPARDYMFRSIEGQTREYETRRLSVLGNIVGGRTNIVCAPVEAALQYTLPRQEFCENTLTLKPGTTIKHKELEARLVSAGYIKRNSVEGPGQFAVRGSIVDIYAPDMSKPCRLEFWGDAIETVHTFDILSQRREKAIKKLYMSPATEVLIGSASDAAALLRQAFGCGEGEYPKDKALLNATKYDIELLDSGIVPSSMDKYLHIRYKKAQTVIDYLEEPIVLFNEFSSIKDSVTAFEFRFVEEQKALYEQGVLCANLTGFYESFPKIQLKAERMGAVLTESFSRTIQDVKLRELISVPSHGLPPWPGDLTTLLEEITPLLAQKYSVGVFVGTKRAASALARDLQAAHIAATAFDKGKEPQNIVGGTVAVLEGRLTAGAHYPFAKLAIFTSRRHVDAGSKSASKPKRKGLSSVSDIKEGDYVVHQNHGIGIYAGVQRLDMQGVVKDYLKLSYSKGDTLYVPVTQLDMVSRYTAPGDSDKVKLSRLGGDAWTKTKTRVKAAATEMAKELLELYAKRESAKGHAFPEDSEWQRDFESRFAYEETNDQLTSAKEIKKDMQRARPMDRLLCGDVGVGKTEVALRAAFKCLMGGKQCAILVPTTILAWQHYNSIISRMESFPVKIGLLSRFRTAGQQRETLRGLREGTVDVVVGTHRLIQKDVKFKDLGLVIVDEEQRFGVKHKERLKEMFLDTDMLTLSATPIPRTLNMALSGLRDMSTIDTPPVERRPVETYVMEYDDIVIADALKREIGRGGQAYYLHNRVETIDMCAAHVAKLVPNAKIGTAHGKMDEQTLSRVWQQLMDAEIDILVCTTLIETGVDVRNCNTLIIENSDTMGLSQLYQLRGRVGRSGRKAYAYFTFRRDKVLTDVASKRLSAIREFTSFGSGFRIAMRDLQIRGAGSILGQNQHGHMESVGYDMYVKLLNSAIQQQKGEVHVPDKSDCLVDISADAYIPETYISDTALRIEAYKRIAAIETGEDAQDVKDELCDRYGPLPTSASGLISISSIRVSAAKLGIYEITQKGDNLIIYSDNLTKDVVKPLIVASKGRLLFNAGTKPYLSLRVQAAQNPAACLEEFLELMDAKKAERAAQS